MNLASSLKNIFGRRTPHVSAGILSNEGSAPELTSAGPWFNTVPLSLSKLRGKVILVDFWTYSCINCIRTLPHIKAWHETYGGQGLTIIGVHTPEFDFEKNQENVAAALKRHAIVYPVVMDNDYAIWSAYKNRYWPAHYFIDRGGNIRYHHFGEGGYEHSEAVIRALLAESGAIDDAPMVSPKVSSDVSLEKIGTPETYLGYDRIEYLGSPESILEDEPRRYSAAKTPARNVFYFEGLWEISKQFATAREAGASITYKVLASKVNLVMEGPATGAKIEVRVDDGPAAGADIVTAEEKSIVIAHEGRLYNLFDANKDYRERLVKITCLDPGVKFFSFTFS